MPKLALNSGKAGGSLPICNAATTPAKITISAAD
jgi:hypothetical protein